MEPDPVNTGGGNEVETLSHSTKIPTAEAPAIAMAGSLAIAGEHVFGPLEFEAPAGRWTAILGRSGCGKTSLLRCIAGLIAAPDLDGAVTLTPDRAGPRFSLMAQSDLLLPWADALDNVTLGARLRGERPDRDRARALLASVGLAGRENASPAELSGGMRQRVALARTLMEDRPVVLLDEPFSALDVATREELQELALERLQGRTVVIVTHDPMEAARLGRSILIMTPYSLTQAPTPGGEPPRPLSDPAVARIAAELTALVRGTA